MSAARTTWAALIVAGVLPVFLGCESEILRTAIRETAEKTVKEIKASPAVKLETSGGDQTSGRELSEDEVKRLVTIIESGEPNTGPAKYLQNGTITYKLPDGSTKKLMLLSINRVEAGLCIDAANNLRGMSQAEIDQLVKEIASRPEQ